MSMVVVVILFFFFSSRRRHTRLQGDWSSDVCSSDLGQSDVDSVRVRGRPDHPPLSAAGQLEGGEEPVALQQKIAGRSEEHTSELQSPCNLVCRLLLEKKKKR